MTKFKIKDSQVDGEQPMVVMDDGTEISLDELGNGYLRQSDYTQKTQALAEQRKAMEAAQANQQMNQVVNQQPEVDPNYASMTRMYVDTKLSQLKNIYGERFDEVAVLNEATKLLGTGMDPTQIDFDSIHKSMAYQDAGSMKEQLRQEILKELAEQNVNTSSIISSMDGTSFKDETHGLNQEEMSYCNKIGMSYEDYAKWKV